ncbi:MAG: hypothetical protein ABQ298_09850 [Puniceicoccaceae bacterium]
MCGERELEAPSTLYGTRELEAPATLDGTRELEAPSTLWGIRELEAPATLDLELKASTVLHRTCATSNALRKTSGRVDEIVFED